MTKQRQPWNPEDLSRLNALVAERLPWPEIGAKLERSWAACKVQYFFQRRLGMDRASRATRQTKMTKRLAKQFSADIAREERQALEPRSMTAEFFGDPIPGRSALDRRNAGEKPETTFRISSAACIRRT